MQSFGMIEGLHETSGEHFPVIREEWGQLEHKHLLLMICRQHSLHNGLNPTHIFKLTNVLSHCFRSVTSVLSANQNWFYQVTETGDWIFPSFKVNVPVSWPNHIQQHKKTEFVSPHSKHMRCSTLHSLQSIVKANLIVLLNIKTGRLSNLSFTGF